MIPSVPVPNEPKLAFLVVTGEPLARRYAAPRQTDCMASVTTKGWMPV